MLWTASWGETNSMLFDCCQHSPSSRCWELLSGFPGTSSTTLTTDSSRSSKSLNHQIYKILKSISKFLGKHQTLATPFTTCSVSSYRNSTVKMNLPDFVKIFWWTLKTREKNFTTTRTTTSSIYCWTTKRPCQAWKFRMKSARWFCL